MTNFRNILLTLVATFAVADPALALDPPHDSSKTIQCVTCHTFHNAPGGTLTAVAGNANLCQSCHVTGGTATDKPFAEADQAKPGLALPAGMSGSGTSHRWDAGPQGRIEADSANTSTGTVESAGAYTGPIIQTYTILISTQGDTGIAEFEWYLELKGGGSLPEPPVPETVRDEFNSISYSGNNGTQNWSINWNEDDDQGGGAGGGNIRVRNDGECASGNCLRIRADKKGDWVYRQADLTNATSATLTYNFEGQLDGKDEIITEVYDGGGWSTVALYDKDSNNGSESFDITAAIASNTRVRFRTTDDDKGGDIWFDNVQIAYTLPPTGGGGPPTGPDGTGVTGTDVPLGDGLTLTFTDGAVSPSFAAGDAWYLYVVADTAVPTDPEMAARLEGDVIMCSTCHDQHSQEKTPFDPAAPVFSGPGTGEGRHNQRLDNDTDQMCKDCHGARDVNQSSLGSHPVGVPIPAGGDYQNPAGLPLDSAGNVSCLSCHDMHYNSASNGLLLRINNNQTMCTECHTLASGAASHFNTVAAEMWPGGQYGSSYPAITDPGKVASCANCHYPHGWPDPAAPASDNPVLNIDFEEGQCYTCHDDDPASADILTDFQKASGHPLAATANVHAPGEAAVVNSATRHIECADCHNPHEAEASVSVPGPSTSRRLANGPLEGVQGVNTAGNAVATATYEYEVCFRCHADSTGKPAAPTPRQYAETNVRVEFTNKTSYHPVTKVGANTGGGDVPSLIGSWTETSFTSCTNCHNSNTGPAAGGAGPNGTHGSTWPSLLEGRYETGDPSTYDQAKYTSCFACHDAANILSDDNKSFGDHSKHIQGEDTACNVCHDPHASSNDRLINFDTSVVTAGMMGGPTFNWNGVGSGSCTLLCHDKDHRNKSY